MTAPTRPTSPAVRPFAEELALRVAPVALGAVAGLVGLALASEVTQDTLRAAGRAGRDKAVDIGQAVRDAQEARLARLRALATAPADVEVAGAASRQERDLEARERFEAIQAATALQAAEIEAQAQISAADLLARAQEKAAELRAAEAPSFANGEPSATGPPRVTAGDVAGVELELRKITRRDFGPFNASTIAELLNGDLVLEPGDDRGAGALAFILPFPSGDRTRDVVRGLEVVDVATGTTSTPAKICVRAGGPIAKLLQLSPGVGVVLAGAEICVTEDHPLYQRVQDLVAKGIDAAGGATSPTLTPGGLVVEGIEQTATFFAKTLPDQIEAKLEHNALLKSPPRFESDTLRRNGIPVSRTEFFSVGVMANLGNNKAHRIREEWRGLLVDAATSSRGVKLADGKRYQYQLVGGDRDRLDFVRRL